MLGGTKESFATRFRQKQKQHRMGAVFVGNFAPRIFAALPSPRKRAMLCGANVHPYSRGVLCSVKAKLCALFAHSAWRERVHTRFRQKQKQHREGAVFVFGGTDGN